ncbi:MAG: HAD family hydrolase [Eubacteriales bacterium]|nr:HAD family hydrolase [Eubacteriaceae bacterium]MDD6476343.1 HAD family hydrolase [Eubacteriales bacterium]
MSIKLVAVDMDGTLLSSANEVPEDFIPWVRSHPDIRTVIASGRQYFTLEHDFREAVDSLIFIAENGALVFEHGEMIYRDVMEEQDIIRCLDIIAGIPHAHPILCGAESAYLVESADGGKNGALLYYKRHAFVKNMEELKEMVHRDSIVKIAIYFDIDAAEKSSEVFSGIGKHLSAVVSGSNWLDISNASVDKGNAIRQIQERYGITAEESMAFGDYLNDLGMMHACGESYCMKNGHPEVMKAARHTAESNDDDGVMKVLRTL